MKDADSVKAMLLYGRSLRFIDSAICGAILGASAFTLFESGLCASALPIIPIGFIVIVLIPVLFIKLALPIGIDIREPRRGDVSFVLGISKKQRIECGAGELLKVNRWLIIFIASASGVDIVGNGAVKHGAGILWTLGLTFLSIIETYAISMTAAFLLKHQVIRASRRDRSGSKKALSLEKISGLFVSLSWALSGAAVLPLRNQVKAIARRQLTDIFRGDPMSGIVVPLCAIPVSVLFALILRDSPTWVTQMIFVFTPYGIVLFNDEAFQEASVGFSSLLNYHFSIRDFFIANCYIVFLMTIPTVVAFLFFGLFLKHGIFGPIGALQFFFTYAFLVVATGCRHSLSIMPNRDMMSAYLTFGFPIVVLPSLGIPVFGLIFPITLITFLLSMERDVLKRTSFPKVL